MARKPGKPGRSPENRNLFDRVLIVCEGAKTELNYFKAIKKEFRLPTAYIEVIHSTHTKPIPIVKYTVDRIELVKDTKEAYDHVFCVIDRDRHPYFDEASELMVKNSIKRARSWPCFEYWLLLHFEYSRTNFKETAKATKSKACLIALKNCIKKELHIPNYIKNYKHFDKFMSRVDTAIANAKKSLKDKRSMEKDPAIIEKNPTATEVHKVVECLMNIRP